MEDLPRTLQAGFDWIVASNQVGAQWRQYNDPSTLRHLGGPSPLNAKDCPLRLWIGVSEPTKELLILLTHSVRIGKNSKAPRRMFLLIPAESLTLDTSADGFQPLALDQVPECLFERPSDMRSAHSNGFLNIKFILDSKRKSTAVMPARPYDGQVRGTALALLDGLKSLSETQEFDLYLRFNSYAQIKLQKLKRTMETQASPFKTPDFDVQALYPGNRDGGFDLWKEQGWHDPALETKCRKRRASEEPDTPPRYRPQQSAQDSLSAKDPPPAYDGSRTAALARLNVTSNSEVEAGSAAVPGSTPCAPVVHVPRSCTPVTRHFSPTSVTSRICETPLITVATPATARATDEVLHSPLTTRYMEEVTYWLLHAWKICPLAHYRCIVQLLNLGLAANTENTPYYEKTRGRLTSRLLAHKAKPSAADDSAQDSCVMAEPSVLAQESSNLITWMLIVDPLADVGMFQPLIEFERHVNRVLELVDKDKYPSSDQEFQSRCSRLLDCKAWIVINICLRYGVKVFASKKPIVEKIWREVKVLEGR